MNSRWLADEQLKDCWWIAHAIEYLTNNGWKVNLFLYFFLFIFLAISPPHPLSTTTPRPSLLFAPAGLCGIIKLWRASRHSSASKLTEDEKPFCKFVLSLSCSSCLFECSLTYLILSVEYCCERILQSMVHSSKWTLVKEYCSLITAL